MGNIYKTKERKVKMFGNQKYNKYLKGSVYFKNSKRQEPNDFGLL